MKINTRNLITAAIIGALYAVLTMVLAPISYGPVQFAFPRCCVYCRFSCPAQVGDFS